MIQTHTHTHTHTHIYIYIYIFFFFFSWGFPDGSVLKNPSVSAGAAEETGSILGSGRSLEEVMVTHSSILARKIRWTEEPGRL